MEKGRLNANVALTLIIMEGFLKKEAHGFSLSYYHRCIKRPRVVEGEPEFSLFNK